MLRFRGATRAFPITSEQCTRSSKYTKRIKEHCPYPSVVVSEKWWSSTILISPIFSGLNNPVICMCSSKGNSPRHFSHWVRIGSGIGSSQPISSLHRSCNILLPRSENGATKSRWSCIELTDRWKDFSSCHQSVLQRYWKFQEITLDTPLYP